jgi:hypothetical protein
LVAVLLGVALLGAAALAPRPSADGLDLVVTTVPLDPTDLSRTSAGSLRYRGGLWLRSADPRFGGLSDLAVSPDGSRLVAVSDCGRFFVAHLHYDSSGDLVGLDGEDLFDLAGPGRPLKRRERDAEALAADGGGYLVGFEGDGRVWRYPAASPGASPEAIPIPKLDGCRDNRGLETVVRLPGGELFLLCEGEGLRPSSSPAWIGEGRSWTRRSYPLDGGDVTVGDVFRPTSAAVLPGGDVLVLERRFPPLAARLRRLAKADLEGTGPLRPRDVALLEPPLTLDNLEGIDARKGPAGETLLTLVSDDNGCLKGGELIPVRLQRTLLLLFELEPGG